MNQSLRKTTLACALAAGASFLSFSAFAANSHEASQAPRHEMVKKEKTENTVKISSPWVRATVSEQKTTGAFMTLSADKTVKLIKVTSPDAGSAQIHSMSMKDGIMEMKEVKKGLKIPKDKQVTLEPGGYHIMLFNLSKQAKVGDEITLNLTFKQPKHRAFTETVKAVVKPLNAMEMEHAKD